MNSEFGVVVMGVSGCGKSTVAQHLAELWQCSFIEGDLFHSTHNVDKMKRGEPLNDNDRKSWLETLGAEAHILSKSNKRWVVTCSALKPKYRDTFRTLDVPVYFLHLTASRNLLVERIESRTNHFMPAALLNSQIADLSVTDDETDVVAVNSDQPLANIVSEFIRAIDMQTAEGRS